MQLQFLLVIIICSRIRIIREYPDPDPVGNIQILIHQNKVQKVFNQPSPILRINPRGPKLIQTIKIKGIKQNCYRICWKHLVLFKQKKKEVVKKKNLMPWMVETPIWWRRRPQLRRLLRRWRLVRVLTLMMSGICCRWLANSLIKGSLPRPSKR